MTLIWCHFDGKVFVPEGPVDLPRNQRVVLHVEAIAPPSAGETTKGAWDVLDRNSGSVQAPADWSAEHDHYLYGTPKRVDGDPKSSNGDRP